MSGWYWLAWAVLTAVNAGIYFAALRTFKAASAICDEVLRRQDGAS